MEKVNAMTALKQRMSAVEPLEDEPEFHTDDNTIVRYLKSSGWEVGVTEARLRQTVEWRRTRRPTAVDCHWCHNKPGFHSMRQVGHDESGRPVVYSNFAQAATHKNSLEDVSAHMTYLIEKAKCSMTSAGTTTWVFVIDCTGMTMSACNPKLGHGMASLLSRHYPERLGLVVCLNHNSVFQGVWKAVKGLVTTNTAAKVKLLSSESKIQQTFSTYFSEELSTWLLEEIALNRRQPLPLSQREFWNPPPAPATHDPRGSPTYIRDYVTNFCPDVTSFTPGKSPCHVPHPNIVDAKKSKVVATTLSESERKEREEAMVMAAEAHH